MSTVKANNVQVGQSGTATNNFTLYQPSTPDGTVRLAVGNSGATTGDVLSVSSTGLSVTGTLTSTGVNTFPAGSASAPSITTTGDTNTGVFFPAADTAAITTGGAERMRITSGGTLNIGTTASATSGGFPTPLIYGKQLNNSGAWSGLQLESNTDDSTLGFGFNGTNFILSTSYRSTGSYKNIAISPQTTTATFNTNQTVKFETSISVGGATPSTSGCGITFPASENLSTNGNTLDDYEEGTWTPTVYGQSTAGTTTYTGQAGRYNKVGNMVTVIAKVAYSAATGTGALLIGGLPFTTYTDSGALRYPGVLWTNNLNWTFGTYVTVWTGGADSTTLQIIGSSDDGALTNEQQLVNESAEIAFSMTYRTS